MYGKDCYMCFEMGDCEGCLYSHHSNGSSFCVDCDEAVKCMYCYEVKDSTDSTRSQWCTGLRESHNCYYSENLQGCTYCLFCEGLTHQKYYVLNQNIGEEKFNEILQAIKEKSVFEKFQKEFNEKLHNPENKYIIASENCSGRNVQFSNSCKESLNCFYCENSSYVMSGYQNKNCLDLQSRKSELCIEGQTLDESYASGIGNNITRCKYTRYSDTCYDCSYCFGCTGLRNKSYCILNKQYSKEEYEHILPKIIAKMDSDNERGEFFHPSISPYGYNETVAQQRFPLHKDQLDLEYTQHGYKRSKYIAPTHDSKNMIKSENLPNIVDADQGILQSTVQCKESGKVYRILPQELKFYKKHDIELPQLHPDIRHNNRMKRLEI